MILVAALAIGVYYYVDRDEAALPDPDDEAPADDPVDDPSDDPAEDPADDPDDTPLPTQPDPAKPKPPYQDPDPVDDEDDEKDDDEDKGPEYPGLMLAGQGEIAMGTKGAAASSDARAARVAAQVLEDGGNAFDAAVALGLFLAVVEPHNSGLGGVGYGLMYNHEEGEIYSVEYRGALPLDLDREAYEQNPDWVLGGMTSGKMPGVVRGYIDVLDRYGTKPFAELARPAMEAARDGIEISSAKYNGIMSGLGLLRQYPGAAEIYLPGGFPYTEGEIFTNPDLANVLEIMMEEGPESFYTGTVAEMLVEGLQAGGSQYTLEDFAAYRSDWQPALQTNYRGYDIYTCDLPAYSMSVLAMLNVMEHFDLPGMSYNTPARMHFISEATKQVRTDARATIGDPNFIDAGPAYYMLTPEYAGAVAASIDINHAAVVNEAHGDESPDPDEGTTHFSVVDKHGNMALFTMSIGRWWGAGEVIGETGILLNRFMQWFSHNPDAVNFMEPGARSRSSMTPTLIMKDDQPVLGLGSPGSDRIISAVLQTTSNIIDHDMSLHEAMHKPRFYAENRQRFTLQPEFDPRVRADMTARGHDATNRQVVGGIFAVSIDWEDGVFTGISEPQRMDSGAAAVR